MIPAHPLALDARRALDPRRQRALARYYVDAGVPGLAVGVHTTQFAIREAGLYEPVLRCAAEVGSEDRPAVDHDRRPGRQDRAGAARGGEARGLGYHAGLLSLAALRVAEDELIAHCTRVAEAIPLVRFYLQPAVGGVVLPAAFWRRFAAIDNVLAIKIAPFNRYRTLDVIRGVVEARAERPITLLTGNDDHIVLDLLTPSLPAGRGRGQRADHRRAARPLVRLDQKAVELVARSVVTSPKARSTGTAGARRGGDRLQRRVLRAANDFAGCIAGCHEVLRRQGLLEGTWCLDPNERLSPGQAEEIDRGTPPIPISTTTPSSPPTSSAGWCERSVSASPGRASRPGKTGS